MPRCSRCSTCSGDGGRCGSCGSCAPGGLTYRELAARVPGMSTSVLTQRLRDLRAAGLVEHEHGAGYRLTALGHDLLVHLASCATGPTGRRSAPARRLGDGALTVMLPGVPGLAARA